MATTHTPIYLDWAFWALIVAACALALSQLPPIRLWRRKSVRLEVYSVIGLTVDVGAPRAQIHVIVTNTGGKSVRISRLRLVLNRADTQFELPANGYFEKPSDTQAVMLAPLTLKPEQEWGHVINCFKHPDQPTLRRCKTLLAPLSPDLRARRERLPPNAPDVPLDPALVAPLRQFFDQQFKWDHGEYRLSVQAAWGDNKITERHFRFTLFESDSQELRSYTEDFTFGYGLILPARRPLLLIPIERTPDQRE
jgi:hypothetical protein